MTVPPAAAERCACHYGPGMSGRPIRRGGADMRDEKKQWPVLLVSGQFGMENDDAFRLRELAAEL